MQQASDMNISIISEEFFTDDPTLAIESVKHADARIIFGICYDRNCGKIACGAYKQKLYGPSVVWIFPNFIDFTSQGLHRPEGCTKEMTDEFAKSVISTGYDMQGHLDEMGHTGSQIIQHIRKVCLNRQQKVSSLGFQLVMKLPNIRLSS